MNDEPPDIVLLGPAWPTRSLLRAQLVENGYDVVATDVWPIPRQYLRRSQQPRLLLIDLHELPNPHEVLDEVGAMIPQDRVLVVTALGTTAPDEVRRRGFHVVTRPTTVGDVAAAAAALLERTPLHRRG
jgi:hypothetical protein